MTTLTTTSHDIMNPLEGPGMAYLSPTGTLHIDGLEITDPGVAAEGCRWTTGTRGEPTTLDDAAGLRLDAYVRAAITIGTTMLGHASDASVTGLATHVSQLAERAETASAALVRAANEAAAQSTAAASQASRDAHEATAKTLDTAIKRFELDAERTLTARVAAVDERLNRLLTGESSEVATSVRTIIASALAETQAGWQASTTAALAEVHRAFDPANESNPLAVATRQIELVQQRHHAELGARIDRVTELVAAAAGAATGAASLAIAQEQSPAKGGSFEVNVGATLETIAAGLGATYQYTGNRVGTIRNCKKGDAVLEFPTAKGGGATPRLLIEATTQVSSRDWVGYLPVAEKNRDCQVSIGIVRSTSAVPGGDALALLGTTRAIVAYDPDTDSPALLRGAIQLLAVEASRRIASSSGSDTALADSKIVAARQQLTELVAIQKVATGARDNASKVVSGLDSLHTTLVQSLDQALAALRTTARA